VNVDVSTSVRIARPRAEVAAYAADPNNATEWYRNIRRVEWKSPPPLRVGSKVAFEAHFLGRTIAYTYEVTELIADELLVMATSEGPFAMETAYSWRDVSEGGTEMTLRNRGKPSGFAAVLAPVMPVAMRRANTADLRRLKEILER
jgi:hypothetical protein